MIEQMVGRELKDEFPKRSSSIGVTRLAVAGLTRGRAVRDVSFGVAALTLRSDRQKVSTKLETVERLRQSRRVSPRVRRDRECSGVLIPGKSAEGRARGCAILRG